MHQNRLTWILYTFTSWCIARRPFKEAYVVRETSNLKSICHIRSHYQHPTKRRIGEWYWTGLALKFLLKEQPPVQILSSQCAYAMKCFEKDHGILSKRDYKETRDNSSLLPRICNNRSERVKIIDSWHFESLTWPMETHDNDFSDHPTPSLTRVV